MTRSASLWAPVATLVIAFSTASALWADGLRVGTADTMVKVPRDGVGPLGVEAAAAIRWGDALRVELARGESESAQLVIAAAPGKPLHGVRVTVGRLVRQTAGGDVPWPAGDLSVWRVGFVEAVNLWEPHENLGWLPDPLLPLDAPFDVSAGTSQPVWLRFRATEGMTAGLYRGEVTVEAPGEPPVRVPIRAELWDFTLPRTQHFTLSIPTWGGQWEAMYPGTMTPQRRREFLDFLIAYRVSPFPLTDLVEMPYCFSQGQRAFCLNCFPVDYVPDDTTKKMRGLAEMWQKQPFAAEATPYVLLGDEAPPKFYPNIKEQGRLVRAAAPMVKRQFTISPETATQGFDFAMKELAGAGDIAILGAANCYHTHEDTTRIRAAGLGLWWYYVASHYYIPERGLEARQIFWRHWKYQIPGQLHWGVSYWGDTNIAGRDGKKWPEIPWDTRSSRTGDGYLVYPATGGTGVWPSIRLEQLRDGVEDYEYFHLLAELTQIREAASSASDPTVGANRRLLAIDDTLVKAYKEYDPHPEAYRGYRRRLARAIMATQR